MFKRLLSVCVVVAALLTTAPVQPVLHAQTLVTVGQQNTTTAIWYGGGYSMYYFYTKIYSAALYNSTVLQQSNGGTAPIGLISKIEWKAGPSAPYGSNWTNKGQTVKVYMGISPTAQFPTGNLPGWTTFVGGGGNTALQNVQLVYEGLGLIGNYGLNNWAPLELTNKYLYTGGHLVIAIQIDKPEGQFTNPGYLDDYGYWWATYLAGDAPNGTNRTAAYWYGYNGYDGTGTGYTYDYYGRVVVRLSILSGIEASFPDDQDPRRVLRAGEIYGGQDAAHPQPSLTFRASPGATNLTFKIVSVSTGQPIYIATEGGNPNDTIINLNYSTSGLVTYNFTSAKGSAAGTNGALDLTNTPGGAFRLVASYSTPASGYNQDWVKEFSIAYSDDLAIRQIVAPNPSTDARAFKYPRGTPIPLQAKFQNVGLNNVTNFRAVAEIRNSANTVVYTDTVNYTGNMATGDIATIDFANFATLNVGSYNVRICGILIGAFDQQSGNDCLPSSGTYTFAVQYSVEAEATAIITPATNGVYYSGRPFEPMAVFTNKGIEDLSDIPATLTIRNQQGTIVYTSSIIISDIARNSSANGLFAKFTAPASGTYEACVSIDHPDDAISANNIVCSNFNVLGQLSGTYTIGTQNQGGTRNFTTMQDAVDALYARGVNGPVIFEL
ncbi:MAG: hypothetical protein V4642_02935, partial [Bacteroidota bacterium]